MGWGSLLGDFAKGFAQGYIEERGIKGTLEDVGDLAKGVKNMFATDDCADDSSEDFIEEYNAMIENEQYNKAKNYVYTYYKQNNLERDYFFYYFLAEIYNYLAVSNNNVNDAENAKKNIKTARQKCPIGSDMSQAIKDLEKTILENLDGLAHDDALMDNWNKTVEEVDELISKDQYALALKKLDNHYISFEDGKYDFHYWSKRFDIHFHQALSESGGGFIKTREIEKDYKNLCNYSQNADYGERIDSVKDELDWIKAMNLYTETKERAEQFASNHDYKRAFAEMKVYYDAHPDEENTFTHWGDLFRYTRLSAEYDLERGIVLGDDVIITLGQYVANIRRDSDADDAERIKEVSDIYDKIINVNNDLKNKSSNIQKTNCIDHGRKDVSNSVEQEYIDELKACFADDGMISDRERRLLDKLRKSLGISEERAKELEVMCNPNVLTPEEQEYADEIKVCLEDDGVISERERRLLTKLSNSLGIPKERALEIEKMVVNS